MNSERITRLTGDEMSQPDRQGLGTELAECRDGSPVFLHERIVVLGYGTLQFLVRGLRGLGHRNYVLLNINYNSWRVRALLYGVSHRSFILIQLSNKNFDTVIEPNYK